MTKLGAAVIGAGNMGKMHARIYKELYQAELIAVADINEERARELATAMGGVDYYKDYTEMLKDERIEVISVTTPDHLHEEPVTACLEAGRHVLVEKPLATSLEACDRMLAAEKKAGKILMVNFNHRWAPPYAATKNQLRQGKQGRPVMAYARKNDTIWVPTGMCPWLQHSSSADFLSSHDIDLVRWFFELEVKSVYACGVKRVLKGMGYDTYDAIQALVRFDGDAIATFESAWIYPDTYPTLTDSFIELVMERGVIHIDRQREMVDAVDNEKHYYPKSNLSCEIEGRLQGAFKYCIEHFLHCAETGAMPMTSAADARKTAEVVAAIHRSLETGQVVELPLR
ncbi:MAG TPA: Gfo/Idh/MocA family oxidoreductase [Firmicutes bacterium]|nr:Gfo/Idh/MocA family oxidoreductase [Bacillota bacterium]